MQDEVLLLVIEACDGVGQVDFDPAAAQRCCQEQEPALPAGESADVFGHLWSSSGV